LKILIYIFLLAIPLKGFSQSFADKSFYLIDSLNLEELTDSDLQLLDSALNIYHTAKHDTDKIIALTTIVEEMIHEDWSKYQFFQYKTIIKLLADHPSIQVKKSLLIPLANALNNIGVYYEGRGENPKALEYHLKSLRIYEKIGHKEGRAISLSNIGLIYSRQNDSPKALSYYIKSLKIQEEIGDKEGIAITSSNIGIIYHNYYKDIPNALKYYNMSLDIAEKTGNEIGAAITLNNIGIVYYREGDYTKALTNYKKALIINEKKGVLDGIAHIIIRMGDVYMAQGEINTALECANRGLKIGKKLNSPLIIKLAAVLLSKLHKQTGDFEKSLEMFVLSISIRDSINNEETNKEVIQQEANYQIEKKEQELKLKEKDVAMLEKDKKLKTYALYSLLMFIVLLATAVYAWFRNYKHKKRAEEIEVNHQIEMYMKEIDILRNQVNVQIIDKTSVVSVGFISNDINSFLSKKLSERELEVLHELSKAKTNQEIAETLFVSVSTVKSHLLSIYEKLDVKNRTQAIKKVHNL